MDFSKREQIVKYTKEREFSTWHLEQNQQARS